MLEMSARRPDSHGNFTRQRSEASPPDHGAKGFLAVTALLVAVFLFF